MRKRDKEEEEEEEEKRTEGAAAEDTAKKREGGVERGDRPKGFLFPLSPRSPSDPSLLHFFAFFLLLFSSSLFPSPFWTASTYSSSSFHHSTATHIPTYLYTYIMLPLEDLSVPPLVIHPNTPWPAPPGVET